MSAARLSPIERFTQKTAPGQGSCIVWTASINSNGYGTFTAAGKTVMAHRWAYEYYESPIPPGCQLDHLCRNRACVNPKHLEPVTARVNLLRADGVVARNAAKTHCPAGHPYAGRNLMVRADGRHCRTCHNDHRRMRRRIGKG